MPTNATTVEIASIKVPERRVAADTKTVHVLKRSMEEVGLIKWEKVLVANMNTGDRFETYVIPAPPRSRRIELNGATARLGHVGDRVIIFSFATYTEAEARTHAPRIVQVDDNNRVVRRSFVTS